MNIQYQEQGAETSFHFSSFQIIIDTPYKSAGSFNYYSKTAIRYNQTT